MTAYYNEFDPGAAAWLRELIKRGLIADGEVDERSILDVRPADLAGYTQCHFFAGIGGWSYALRLAGWGDDRPVWTGSPPCQPFSVAGEGLSRDDPRHLAPHFVRLVGACRPGVLFGEQVASAEVFGKAASGARKRVAEPPAWAWLDDLSDRLEAARYAVGASDFPSAGVGAPHIRQRTFFGAVRMADTERDGQHGSRDTGQGRRNEPADSGCASGGLVDGQRAGLEGHGGDGDRGHQPGRIDAHATGSVGAASAAGGLADANGRDACAERQQRGGEQRQQPQDGGTGGMADDKLQQRPITARLGDDPRGRQQEPAAASGLCSDSGTSPLHGFWRDADWLFCRDGKWRPVEPSLLGLADGLPRCVVPSGPFVPASYPLAQGGKDARRVMRLRGYGNAINPHAAAQFIAAFDAATREVRAAG